MAAKGVLIEANLISNSVILEVPPEDHPYAWFRKMGVPVALSTDDSGISRSELSGDYIFAVPQRRHLRRPEDRAARNARRLQLPAGGGAVEPTRTPIASRWRLAPARLGNAEPKAPARSWSRRATRLASSGGTRSCCRSLRRVLGMAGRPAILGVRPRSAIAGGG